MDDVCWMLRVWKSIPAEMDGVSDQQTALQVVGPFLLYTAHVFFYLNQSDTFKVGLLISGDSSQVSCSPSIIV